MNISRVASFSSRIAAPIGARGQKQDVVIYKTLRCIDGCLRKERDRSTRHINGCITPSFASLIVGVNAIYQQSITSLPDRPSRLRLRSGITMPQRPVIGFCLARHNITNNVQTARTLHRLVSGRCHVVTMAMADATAASCQDNTVNSIVPFACFKICTACSWVAPSSVSLLTARIWSPRFRTPFSEAAPFVNTVLM